MSDKILAEEIEDLLAKQVYLVSELISDGWINTLEECKAVCEALRRVKELEAKEVSDGK